MAARITDPAAAPPATVSLSGLLGDSDKPDHRRLYLNTRLDYWVEFSNADVVAVDDIGADQKPFVGLDATRVTLSRDAHVEYVHRRPAQPGPLQVQAQLQRKTPFDDDTGDDDGGGGAETWEAECQGPSWGGCETDFGCGTNNDCPSGWTVCKPATCRVTERATCDTCRTCDDATCVTCRGATCVTCGTCRTCGQATCATCNQATCVTCAATCQVTCAATCVTCAGFTCRQDICERQTQLQTHCNTCRCVLTRAAC